MAPKERLVTVIVEIPQGCRNKYEYDEKLQCFRLDRMLFASVHYPSDYGYIRGTRAPDGDPLDAMAMVGEPTFPGCAIYARPVGLFQMSDEKGPDEKVLCVPAHDPRWQEIEDVDDVPQFFKMEVEHFFAIYKELEDKKVRIGG
jgi:inorganic pyrophosphatase